jgi:hypothetical protein
MSNLPTHFYGCKKFYCTGHGQTNARKLLTNGLSLFSNTLAYYNLQWEKALEYRPHVMLSTGQDKEDLAIKLFLVVI